MKKTKLIICLVLMMVMLFGALQVFATETETTTAVEETTTAVEETTAAETTDETTNATVTAAPAVDDSVCPKTGGEHEFQDGWKTSNAEHWHYCKKCQKKIGIEAHTLGEVDENYQRTCSVCQKKVDEPHEHGFAQEWLKNAYTHWHACTTTYGLKGATFCKEKAEEAEHTFGEDGLCTVCGAEDVVPEERPGDAGIKWIVIIAIVVVGAAASVVVFLKKER